MIVLGTANELAEALESQGLHGQAEAVKDTGRWVAEDILIHFMQPEGFVLECLDAQNQRLPGIYGRHINPGHTSECMWFLADAAKLLQRPEWLKKALATGKATAQNAWDEEYGGMFYYMDCEGGRPKGSMVEAEKVQAAACLRDWSHKMWWPHTETTYFCLLGYALTGDHEFKELYKRYHDYTFSVFPTPDAQIDRKSTRLNSSH